MDEIMNEQEVRQYWDYNAPAWIKGVRAGHDIYRDHVNNPAFLRNLPGLDGKTLLDVGCGEGYNTRKFADLGAQVIGIDISPKMIQAARECEQHHNRAIQYIVASGADLSMFEDSYFNVVLSTMAFMDMPDYTGCIKEISRVIKPSGFFQFSITHPCSMTRAWEWIGDEANPRQYIKIGNYFGLNSTKAEDDISEWYFNGATEEIKKKVTKFKVPDFYRTLSEYFNTLVDFGFIVTRLLEPFANNAIAENIPELAETRNIPYSLIFQCKKP